MNTEEQAYLDILKRLLQEGLPSYKDTDDQKAVALDAGHLLKFSLKDGRLPVITTKKVAPRLPIEEMIWVLSGSTNISYLQSRNVTIWDEWADAKGEIGALYGFQLRHWLKYNKFCLRTFLKFLQAVATRVPYSDSIVAVIGAGIRATEVDQLDYMVKTLQKNPMTRSARFTTWRPDMLDKMSINPCHTEFQIVTRRAPDGSILCSGALNQRSCDMFLGVPFNIVGYSWLTHLIAYHLGFKAESFTWFGNHVHLYDNHREQAEEQIQREPFEFPTLTIRPFSKRENLWDYEFSDFIIDGYTSHPLLKGEVSVQGKPKTGKAV